MRSNGSYDLMTPEGGNSLMLVENTIIAYRGLESLDSGPTGANEWDQWEQIHKAMDQRRGLVHAEARPLAASRQLLTAEQVPTLVAPMMEIVKAHVTDRVIVSALVRGMAGVVRRDPDQLEAWENYSSPQSKAREGR